MIEGEEYPGEMVSFVKSDEEHWKSVKVRRPHPALACIHYFDGSVLHCPWIITTYRSFDGFMLSISLKDCLIKVADACA